jgi:outer membrane lipoprotein LolB
MKAGLLPGLALFVAGCAALPPLVPQVPWDERRARLLSLEQWQARGRIAVKSATGGGQGDLQWRQAGAVSDIRVSGPFGAGVYQIRWEPDRLTVRSRDGEFSRAYDGADAAEQFLAEQLGWSFPAASVRYWVLGVLDPTFAGAERFAANGGLAGIEQNGWSVTYDRFNEAAGVPMPAKLTLRNDRARVRLVIDRWELAIQP